MLIPPLYCNLRLPVFEGCNMISSNYDTTDCGMLGISVDDESMVTIENQLTDESFKFHRDYLDEVVDTLNEFRRWLASEATEDERSS